MLASIPVRALLEFYLNDKKVFVKNPDPTESLISYLRRSGLTGTKLGCSEGGCGSCTVVVSHYDYLDKKINHLTVNACLAPLVSMNGKHVITVEGLGNTQNPHPVQEKIANFHGSQCGFCTPGIVMSLYALLRNNPSATDHDIEESFDGNLCRCTGYRPILDGAKKFLVNKKPCKASCSEEGYCKSKNATERCSHSSGDGDDIEDIKVHPDLEEREIVLEFPKVLLNEYENGRLATPDAFYFDGGKTKWFQPSNLDQMLDIMHQFPNAKVINGNTEVGIEVRFKSLEYPILILPSNINELKTFKMEENGVSFGGCMTIAKFQKNLLDICDIKKSNLKRHQIRGFEALLENIRWFAGNQIRNVAAIAGNIVTASPISDLNPIFVAMGAVLTVQSKENGLRKISMEEFFIGYRKTALLPSEIVISIFVPYTREFEYIKAYKQAKRKDDDIAIVNASLRFNLERETEGYFIETASFAYGGMAPMTIRYRYINDLADFKFFRPMSAIKSVTGRFWSPEVIPSIQEALLADMPMSATTPGGQVEFRKTLAYSFMEKFGLYISHEISQLDKSCSINRPLNERLLSSLKDIERDISKGSQSFEQHSGSDVVGKSTVHLSALKQVTGEAVYTDDIPKLHNELYAIVVGSTEAHANIISVDYSEALEVEGVVDYISWKDIPNFDIKMDLNDKHNPNIIGPVFKDEELFATKTVHFVGQMIGMIIAHDERTARYASKKVKVTYEKLPTIFTIEEAIDKKSFFPYPRELANGNFSSMKSAKKNDDRPLSLATKFVSGKIRMSAQEHFYLETNVSLVVPKKEDGEIEVFASSQHPSECQHLVAHVLGVLSNKVTVRVKRMGGGFGGKETRAAFLTCGMAVAARKHGVPVRCMLSREDDMVMSGYRHPFLGDYKCGFTEEGKLISLECDVKNIFLFIC
ncbi:hypothetical protein HK099_001575 [Clydaea vesicula]|uniref:Xanthine dehydrogenase n=1 Tax=Clydaea vesicula TaxID=447962 RepID=A0AAD5U3C6_9FUNG|nr:hypothetical protein HK099_001575 [Clydaea vesicula]